MYLRYFGFEHYPFAVTPDPAFLYLSASHREALAHLLYGAGEHGGFVSLIGEVGTGKTTLIRAVVDSQIDDLDIALCWNPQLEVREFVATVCDELGVAADRDAHTSLKSLTDRLNTHLLEAHAANRRTVLIVDEAQNLSRYVLEQLRLLTNLETHKHKLLRIILVGQPELSELLARHDLRQLAQRITARSILKPLGQAETRAYIQHRLDCANGPQHLFTHTASTLVCWMTGGVPRLINMVCERALMGAYAHGRSVIGAWTVLRAGVETLPRKSRREGYGWLRLALPTGLAAAALVVVGLAWLPDIPLTSAAEWMHGHEPSLTARSDSGGTASPKDAHAGTSSPNVASVDDAADTPADVEASSRPADTAPDGSEAPSADAADPAGQSTAVESEKPGADQKEGAATDAADKSPTGQPSNVIPEGNADMSQLLRLWGVFGAEIHSGCGRLNVGDLRCLDDKGDLERLRRYNRPALLTLAHDDKKQTVLLSALGKNKATLVGGDGTRDVTLDALKAHWTGRFRMVWRADAGVRLIRPGSVGNAVVWLRDRLDRIDGHNPDARAGKSSPVYDHALGNRLKQFQKSHGLTADGIAGPRTQMMLNGSIASPGTPALAAVSSDKD